VPGHNPTRLPDGAAELSSRDLIGRARQGDDEAIGALFARHVPAVRRWARGRLPRWARDIADTADLVQDAVLNTLRRLDRFEPRGQHALQAYLRAAVQNQINDELRRVCRRPRPDPVDPEMPSPLPSPLADAIDSENERRYRQGLSRLSDTQRALVVGRLELGYSYEQLALLSGKGTPGAARVALRRALLRMAEEMARE
jgi:RNA polymerase sigma-70 factor (ECF subfamily)